jgi:hypothetical protein
MQTLPEESTATPLGPFASDKNSYLFSALVLTYKPFCYIKAQQGQKEITMEELNSNPNETAPVASTPEATSVPVVAAPAVAVTSTVAVTPTVAVTSTVAAAKAPVAAVKMELPKTTGQTVGGWNRFAGYNPAAAKNKKNDRRGDNSKGGR